VTVPPPAPWEVAVQIDAPCVRSRRSGDSVRVCILDDPEVALPRKRHRFELLGDPDPRRLVAMDTTDDERPSRRIGIATLDDYDRATANGTPD
jgi:hypothetical protein